MAGHHVSYTITYDSSKWTLLETQSDTIECYFTMKGGKVDAFIVPEKNPFDMEQIPDFLLIVAILNSVDQAEIVDGKFVDKDSREDQFPV